MKKFYKYLAIGLGIAVAAALAICFCVWSLHSLHRFIWFIIVAIGCISIGNYLSKPDYVECNNPKGKTDYEKIGYRKMTKGEQIGVIVRTIVGCVILGALVWAIGYGVACLFEWKPDFWEMYLLYGAGAIAAVCLVFFVICSAWRIISDVIHNCDEARESVKAVLIWIAVVVCSLAVAGAILYFLFPLALRY